MIDMRMWQQVMVVAAVVFATVAVGVNVYASTRGAEQRVQRLAAEIPVASVLDQGVFDVPPVDRPSRDSDGRDDPCAYPDECPDARAPDDNGDTRTHPDNHGQVVSTYARHIGWDHIAGPPGLLVRDIARSDQGKEDKQPPVLEDKDDKQPPGLNKDDDKTPPGLDKDETPPAKKDKDG